jgi:hypothetical protein
MQVDNFVFERVEVSRIARLAHLKNECFAELVERDDDSFVAATGRPIPEPPPLHFLTYLAPKNSHMPKYEVEESLLELSCAMAEGSTVGHLAKGTYRTTRSIERSAAMSFTTPRELMKARRIIGAQYTNSNNKNTKAGNSAILLCDW